MHTTDLDQRLRKSDPARELTPTEHRLVAEMVARSAPVKKGRVSRPVAVGVVAAVLLGGGGVAAATAAGVWEGWAQNDALATLRYELPSGASCEWRLGDITGAPAVVDDIVRDTLSDVRVTAADVAEGAAHVGVTGDPLTDDSAFETGYAWAVNLRLQEAYAAHGFDGQWWDLEGQGICV